MGLVAVEMSGGEQQPGLSAGGEDPAGPFVAKPPGAVAADAVAFDDRLRDLLALEGLDGVPPELDDMHGS